MTEHVSIFDGAPPGEESGSRACYCPTSHTVFHRGASCCCQLQQIIALASVRPGAAVFVAACVSLYGDSETNPAQPYFTLWNTSTAVKMVGTEFQVLLTSLAEK